MAQKKKSPGTDPEKEYPDIKPYPPKDDIYSRDEEEEDIDPEDISRDKTPNLKKSAKKNEEDFKDDMTGEDLDIPGNEQDEDSEDNGDEDEENNYYSEADN